MAPALFIRVLPEALWEPRDFVITAHIAIAARRHRRMGRRAHLPKAYPDGSRTPIRSHRRVSISWLLPGGHVLMMRGRMSAPRGHSPNMRLRWPGSRDFPHTPASSLDSVSVAVGVWEARPGKGASAGFAEPWRGKAELRLCRLLPLFAAVYFFHYLRTVLQSVQQNSGHELAAGRTRDFVILSAGIHERALEQGVQCQRLQDSMLQLKWRRQIGPSCNIEAEAAIPRILNLKIFKHFCNLLRFGPYRIPNAVSNTIGVIHRQFCSD